MESGQRGLHMEASVKDTAVESLSTALRGKVLDWVVSGSIAAVEVVKAIRAVRRLGAQVRVTMTREAQRFITPTACAWASGNAVSTDWNAFADHIGEGDALVIAPCSASLLAKLAAAICDAPALSLAASYLGQGKLLLVHPCMHQTLAANPFLQDVYQRLHERVRVIAPLNEEGKEKFLPPQLLAEHIAYHCNGAGAKGAVLIVSGGTVGAIDAVRGIANFSSGMTGTLIAAELYRQGFDTHVVCGTGKHRPATYGSLVAANTPQAMHEHAQRLLDTHPDAALVMVAAVLDFAPATPVAGKISSQQQELHVRCVKVPKLIHNLQPRSQVKVVFKLPATFDPQHDAKTMLADYFDLRGATRASLLVVNPHAALAPENYRAYLFSPDFSYTYVQSRHDTARCVSEHIAARLPRKKNKLQKN